MANVDFTVENNVGVITFNRPDALNAINWAMGEQFAEWVAGCQEQPLTALMITGTGRTFIAGGDIHDHDTEEATGRRLATTMGDTLRMLTTLPYPVIAAMNGNVYGGGWEIASACDIRVMAEGASIHFVQAKMGLTSGWGGVPRLVKLVGASRTAGWLLTAAGISAEQAHAAGFIHHVCPSKHVLDKANQIAQRIDSLSAYALGHLKGLIEEAAELPLDEAYAAETRRFIQTYIHDDHGQAVANFLARKEKSRDD